MKSAPVNNNLVLQFYLDCSADERNYLHSYADKLGIKSFSISFQEKTLFGLKPIVDEEKIRQKLAERALWIAEKPILNDGDLTIPIIFV